MTTQRIILISGANKGIGLETARQLGREGHTVLLGARDQARGEAAAQALQAEGLSAHFLHIDVDSGESIAKAAREVEDRFGRVDTLVNNAGVVLETWGGGTLGVSLETWRRTFETNLFSVIAVTQAFLPLLRRSAAGRIVNLSSILGSLGLHADPAAPIYHFKSAAYDAAKAALNSYTIHLAYDLRESGIKVNSAHPGWVKTDLGGASAPMEIADGARTSVWLATLGAEGPTGGFFHQRERVAW